MIQWIFALIHTCAADTCFTYFRHNINDDINNYSIKLSNLSAHRVFVLVFLALHFLRAFRSLQFIPSMQIAISVCSESDYKFEFVAARVISGYRDNESLSVSEICTYIVRTVRYRERDSSALAFKRIHSSILRYSSQFICYFALMLYRVRYNWLCLINTKEILNF